MVKAASGGVQAFMGCFNQGTGEEVLNINQSRSSIDRYPFSEHGITREGRLSKVIHSGAEARIGSVCPANGSDGQHNK
jgi:hypothetical protein